MAIQLICDSCGKPCQKNLPGAFFVVKVRVGNKVFQTTTKLDAEQSKPDLCKKCRQRIFIAASKATTEQLRLGMMGNTNVETRVKVKKKKLVKEK
jgi:hypothetical protein